MYIVLGGEQIIRYVRRGIREHGAVVIFHLVGRDTVIEKVAFEQRGLKELARQVLSHHLGGGSSEQRPGSEVPRIFEDQQGQCGCRGAGGRRWERVSDLEERGKGGSGSD